MNEKLHSFETLNSWKRSIRFGKHNMIARNHFILIQKISLSWILFFMMHPIISFSQSTVFSQNFDGVWSDATALSPAWTTTGTLNFKWHRNDYAGADWTSPASGTFTPAGATGTTNSARFHTYSANPASAPSGVGPGIITTPNINLLAVPSATLTFYYMNGDGTDQLNVSFSNDGGSTFTSQSNYTTTGTTSSNGVWQQKTITIASAYWVTNFQIRFSATSDYGFSDIGLDEVVVSKPCSATTTNTWAGLTTAWNTASNWSLGTVPTACNNVVINSGAIQPTISSGYNPVCNDLTINSGGTLTASIGTSNAFSVYGDIAINSGGTLLYTSTGAAAINANGNITNNGTLTESAPSTTGAFINMAGSAKTIGGTGTYTTAAGATAAANKGLKININSGANIIATNNIVLFQLNINSGGSFSLGANTVSVYTLVQTGGLNLNTGTLEVEGQNNNAAPPYSFFTQATFNGGTGTVYFNSGTRWPAQDQWALAPFTFYHLKARTNSPLGGFFYIFHIDGNASTTICQNFDLVCPATVVNSSGVTVTNLTTGFAHMDYNLIVNGNFTIGTNAIFDCIEDIAPYNGNYIDLYGNWTNDGKFIQRNTTAVNLASVNFLGGANQTIGGTSLTTFYNMEINKTGGSSVQLLRNVRVGSNQPAQVNPYTLITDLYDGQGQLQLTSGVLDLNQYTLTMMDSLTTGIIGGSSNSYIKSETNSAVNPSIIQWTMNATTTGAYTFPFGVAGTYIPFIFNKTSIGAVTMSVSTRATSTNDNTPWAGASNVAAVSNMTCTTPTYYADGSIPSVIDRWWDIQKSAAVTADLTFTYRGSENTTTVAPVGTFAAQHWNGTSWDAPVGSGTGVTSGTGVVTVTGATTFSPWVLTSSLAPLPIELLSFTGKNNGNVNELHWITATETNNDYFTLEHSNDAINFTPIATTDGAGNSNKIIQYENNDRNPYNLTFYRLKQTDFDGKETYSEVISVDKQFTELVEIYPNPAADIISISLGETLSSFFIEIYDLAGKKIISQQLETISRNATFDVSSLQEGFYMINILSEQHGKLIYNSKLVKVLNR